MQSSTIHRAMCKARKESVRRLGVGHYGCFPVDELRALVAIPNVGGRYSTRILPEPEKLASLRLRAGELLAGSDARPALSRRFGTSSHEHRKSAALD